MFGNVKPSGKLPLSFPHRNEDNPAFLNYRSEKGRTIYGEGVYVGYRFYEKCQRNVAFPFGFGLSYTTFKYSSLSLQEFDDTLAVALDVHNTGDVDGAEVVQVYVAQHSPSIWRPLKELKGFRKVFIPAGKSERVTLHISKKYATSFWDEYKHAWVQENGRYTVLVGDSSAHTPLSATFNVEQTAWWNGLRSCQTKTQCR
ncbi:Glycoside hydrolase family 3 [Penicillium maclennaniae]|uniref:Glycoside hydrolase family 3 n=1 Tax=Penicillium maclennaniae TaxID=1343394 RepID=UPI00254026ED|nr:Glycoside hydrolase family 3 [Penicillium maclennaniae]KAJ5681667.1 Glycoside hydrolase family 3 [Penicillium maclennaniae]